MTIFELTVLLVLAAGVFWLVLGRSTRARRQDAAEAARRAVEARMKRDEDQP